MEGSDSDRNSTISDICHRRLSSVWKKLVTYKKQKLQTMDQSAENQTQKRELLTFVINNLFSISV